MKGRVKLEDAGFDWKVLGPDVADVDYVAWQCDHDAYGTHSYALLSCIISRYCPHYPANGYASLPWYPCKSM